MLPARRGCVPTRPGTKMGEASGTTYELYYNSFSICSLMVLLTLRWKGEPKSPDLAVDPVEKEIDIYLGEQMTADFLEKTWKGQVRRGQRVGTERHCIRANKISLRRFPFCWVLNLSRSPTASTSPTLSARDIPSYYLLPMLAPSKHSWTNYTRCGL